MNQIEMHIVFTPENDGIQLAGPLTQKTLCLGILERAKQAVIEFDPNKNSGIIIPNSRIPPLKE